MNDIDEMSRIVIRDFIAEGLKDVEINELYDFDTTFDKIERKLLLMQKLHEGEQSVRENGWLTADEVEKSLGIK